MGQCPGDRARIQELGVSDTRNQADSAVVLQVFPAAAALGIRGGSGRSVWSAPGLLTAQAGGDCGQEGQSFIRRPQHLRLYRLTLAPARADPGTRLPSAGRCSQQDVSGGLAGPELLA